MALRRSNVKSPIFGAGRELQNNVLPTYEDVMKLFILITHSSTGKKQYRDLVHNSSEIVATQVEDAWYKASIPIIEHRTILARIKAYHEKYRNILKPYESRKNVDSYKYKLLEFQNESKKLFDIATCKCKTYDNCLCEKDRKVPLKERVFLSDQRTIRSMMIGTIDRNTTKKNENNIDRKLKREIYEKNMVTPDTNKPITSSNVKNVSQTENQVSQNSTPQILSNTTVINSTSTKVFPVVARTLDRYGVSDRVGAAIVSATLQDIGLITQNDTSNVVDRSKIRRARSKKRTTVIEASSLNIEEGLLGLFYDGRKDKTLFYDDNRRRVLNEEHISLVKEPGSEYIGHIHVETGDAKTIARHIISFLTLKSINYQNILAIGCDGTAVNTGNKAGVIRILEENFQKPLQWLVCQLHANELILRHLFNHLDGNSSGPKTFTGPIGKSLYNIVNNYRLHVMVQSNAR
jgi:hypothetical protein